MAVVQTSAVPFNTSRKASGSTRAGPGSADRQRHRHQYEDIYRESLPAGQPYSVNGLPGQEDMPEDHMEDLVSLPIAPELIPRKMRSKHSLGTIVSESSGSAAFPSVVDIPSSSSSPPINQNGYQIESRSGELASMNDDNRTRQINESEANGISKISPPKRTDSLRKRTQSTPLRSPSSSSAKKRSAGPIDASSPCAGKMTREGSAESNSSRKASSGAAASPRVRAMTNNLPASRKNVAGPSTPRRPSHGNVLSQSTSARNVSTPISSSSRAKAAPRTPISGAASRQRSASVSLLNDMQLQGEDSPYDPNAQPPWLADRSEIMYRSDLTAPPDGSLAQIAMQAKQKRQLNGDSSFSSQQQADEFGPLGAVSPSSVPQNGGSHASPRTWDDVIVPAVAKQIRAQQAQARRDLEATEDEEVLVEDWNSDGMPTKWRKMSKKPPKEGEPLDQLGTPTPTARDEGARDGIHERDVNKERARDSLAYQGQGASQPYGNASAPTSEVAMYLTSHTTTMEQGTSRSGPADASPDNALPYQNTPQTRPNPPAPVERTEVWQEASLASPGVYSSFQSQQRSPAPGGAVPRTPPSAHRSEKQGAERPGTAGGSAMHQALEKGQQKREEEGSHGKGGCRCIIM